MSNINYDLFVYVPRGRRHISLMREIAQWLRDNGKGEFTHMRHWTNVGLNGRCDQGPIYFGDSHCAGVEPEELTQELRGKTFPGDPWHIGHTFSFEDADTALLFKLTFGGAA